MPAASVGYACWASDSWREEGVDQIESGAILFNAGVKASAWNTEYPETGCTYLHHTIIHEVGHAFGIGTPARAHPLNRKYSVMSYDDTNLYCNPQAYDIVALMALYQSM